jgi:general secretion pathway protein D
MIKRFQTIKQITLLFILLQVHGLNAADTGLNFQNADIRSVITAVSKSTGKNFIIDPRVNGKVTLISSSEVDADDLYDVFLSILKVHGFAAIPDPDNNVIKILPAVESKAEANLASNAKNSNEMIIRVIQIHNTQAIKMIPILRPLVSKNGHLTAYQDSNNIIIADTKKNIDKIVKIIKQMDSESEASNIKSIKLHNASAVEIADTLRELLQANRAEEGKKADLSIVADERTNSIMVNGSLSDIEKVNGLLSDLDTPTLEQSGTAVVKVSYAEAKNIADILNKMLSSKERETEEKGVYMAGETQVSVDEKANSVVIIGPPKEVNNLRKVVNQLDVKRSQIMVEALIVEMTDDKSKNLGIKWSAIEGLTNTNLTNFIGGLGAIGTIGTTAGSIQAGDLTFGALAEMLASNANANLVSAPSIMTLENEEAEISVGREVPFLTGSYTAIGTGSADAQNPFTTITRNNIGLTLKITPQITKGNVVKLKIDQEFSNVLPDAQTTIGAADVVTSKRVIKTNALVKDGNLLVLGGLIDDNIRESENRVPGVSSLPVLGHLFRSRATIKEKRNLMVFIRPRIIPHEHVANRITENRYNYIRNLQIQKSHQGVNLMPEEKQPIVRNEYPQHISQPVKQLSPPSEKQLIEYTDEEIDEILGY